MRIAIVAESFLPHMNGVTGSVLQALKYLSAQGHELLVIAPDAGKVEGELYGAKLKLIKAIAVPQYPQVKFTVVRPAKIARILEKFEADVVHLASPFALGYSAVQAAALLDIPVVAVYQTDVRAFVGKYGIPGGDALVNAHVAGLHRKSTLTLAPSSAAEADMRAIGVDRLRRWARGVDSERFDPARRNEAWRASIAEGKKIIGFVGRLAQEKQVEDLRAIADLPDTQLVIVGDGPSREHLEEILPNAQFVGFKTGDELGEIVASFDVFVHTGEAETFCQAVQEALSAGVPVVATGKGGPLDLVHNGIDGWLYEPDNLQQMRAYVSGLLSDDATRAAFAAAARASVAGRTWEALVTQLAGYYQEAIDLHKLDKKQSYKPSLRAGNTEPKQVTHKRWRRYVALGDSITEGLGDTSRMPEGEFLGWAARLAMLMSDYKAQDGEIGFANLAVRSRKVTNIDDQIEAALALEPDFISLVIGANDLVSPNAQVQMIADRLREHVIKLKTTGADILLGTVFLPNRQLVKPLQKRFAEYNARVREIAAEFDCFLLDTDFIPDIGRLEHWSEDKIHLASSGHRLLAYTAAQALGVRDAATLQNLDARLHDAFGNDPRCTNKTWIKRYFLPWVWLRMRGRTPGDGLLSKHTDYVPLIAGNLPLAELSTPARIESEIGHEVAAIARGEAGFGARETDAAPRETDATPNDAALKDSDIHSEAALKSDIDQKRKKIGTLND